MEIPADLIGARETYKLLTGLIVPRPIAWVTSVDEAGIVNLAPFSAYTYLSTKPPMIGISITRKTAGRKDTACNIEATGGFVVNIADETLAEPLHLSSAEYERDISEPEQIGLELVTSGDVAAPRLAVAPAAMECVLDRIVEFGEDGTQLFAGRIVRFHVRDDLIADGKIPSDLLRPLGRIAGPRYAKLGDIIEAVPLHEGSRNYAQD